MHTRLLKLLALAFLAAMTASLASAADIAGRWSAAIETAIGTQNYVYTFKVDGAKLTGTAKQDAAESPIEDGKVEGDKVSFVENRKFDDNAVRIEYVGKIVSANEIRFTRVLAAFGATEEFVAKRSQ
jgi:hypothetical protein